jgi:hypothetical protein
MRPFALLFIAALLLGTVRAQTGCPANVKAIPLHKVNQHQMIVSVAINGSGPYDFLLDTGTQMTVIDLSLAADLRLSTTGNIKVAGVSLEGPALYARLDRLQVGDHVATKQGVLVYDMKTVQGAGFALRGLLGEDFLSSFDVLIDKSQNVLCLDDTGAMLKGMNSGRTAQTSADGSAHQQPPVAAAP